MQYKFNLFRVWFYNVFSRYNGKRQIGSDGFSEQFAEKYIWLWRRSSDGEINNFQKNRNKIKHNHAFYLWKTRMCLTELQRFVLSAQTQRDVLCKIMIPNLQNIIRAI
jgi:bisphosphoglycerate-dependent phosphoglycerate mutase